MTVLFTFTGPISPKARYQAEQLCKQQATPQKGEQVLLNILSVSFTNSYLQCMGFETDLEKSYSWNPVQQTLMDIADLRLKDLGLLECRPVLSDTQFVYVPPEVQSNRIGYVVVQIDKSFREATLLGFVKQVSTELLPIDQLQPLENLLEYLEILLSAKQVQLVTEPSTVSKNFINLRPWLENTFDIGWQEISAVLNTQSEREAWNLRGTNFAGRGKLIDLRKQVTAQSVILVVVISSEDEPDIIVEVHPTSEQIYLPPNLQLAVLDCEGVAVMEAQARSTNKNIQLQFSGEPGERFSVKVTLGEVSASENFVI